MSAQQCRTCGGELQLVDVGVVDREGQVVRQEYQCANQNCPRSDGYLASVVEADGGAS